MWQFLIGTCFGVVISRKYPEECATAIRYGENKFTEFVKLLEEKENKQVETGNPKED